MTDETVDPTWQSEDSPIRAEEQSSDDVNSEVARLQAENNELKSRIGSLAQKAGAERKDLEENWNQWASNYQAWTEAELRKRDKVIERYEERFMELSDAEGAKVVLEERRSREAEEKAAKEARAEAERLRRDEINSAIEDAVRAFELEDADIRALNPQDAKGVWAAAARLNRDKERQRAEAARAPHVEPPVPVPAPTYDREAEVREQERLSRTPGESRGDVRPAASRRQDDFQTRLNELEEALAEAKRTHRTAAAIAIRGEIIAVKKQRDSAR